MASILKKACERVSARPTAHTCRIWLDACAAFEAACEMCSNCELRGKARYLERVSVALWRHGDRSSSVAAIHALQIAALIVAQGEPPAVPRSEFASELEGAILDVGDALDSAGRALADPMVRQVDALTEMLWSRGDNKHARAAIHLQHIAVTLIQSGVSV